MSKFVTLSNGQAVTTSLALAEGTGVQHKNVLELVREYINDLSEFEGVAFQAQPFATAGGMQSREVAILNEQHATLLLTYMKNSEVVRKFKKTLVKEFWAMRNAQHDHTAFLNDPQAMRGVLLVYTEKVIALEAKVEEDAPKVVGFDRLTEAQGCMNITEAAKSLKMKRKDLIHMLACGKWVYRRAGSGSWLGYQSKVHQGLLSHKISEDIETNRIYTQVMLTPKGLAKVASELGIEGIKIRSC